MTATAKVKAIQGTDYVTDPRPHGGIAIQGTDYVTDPRPHGVFLTESRVYTIIIHSVQRNEMRANSVGAKEKNDKKHDRFRPW